jgi:DNA-binding NtrC family response regulator
MEKQAILAALDATGGNRKQAAARLGLALRTLQYKLKELGLIRR